MASIDNIVSKNVGKLGKRFLGGVSRKMQKEWFLKLRMKLKMYF